MPLDTIESCEATKEMAAIQKSRLTERSLLIFCVVLGVLQAWNCRYARIPDGAAYLDIGDAYLRGNWSAAINGYWSPMYSWWLGVALYILKPSMRWESIVLHLVNLIIYVCALFAFRFLVHSILRAQRETKSGTTDEWVALPEIAFLGLGYSLFLWGVLVLIDVSDATPDLLLAAFVFLSAGYLVELRNQAAYWKFGLCGAAYLTKTVMFPLGLGFLLILLFSGRITKARVSGVLLAGTMFLVVCAPFILALSKAKGRFTYGDTGKLAYAALVSPGTPQRNWQGEPAGSGTPRHPTRQLLKDPAVFEFGEPISGTYPSWDDPSYWNEGLQWSFRLRPQIRVLLQSGVTYERLLLSELGLLAGVFIFLLMGGGKPALGGVVSNWPLIAASFLSLCAYSLVLVLQRYIGASMVILFVALFAGIRLPKDERFEPVAKWVAAAVVITILLTVIAHMGDVVYANVTVGAEPQAREEVKAAAGLQNMGLRAGDKATVVGRVVTNQWARWWRFKIIAEVAPSDQAIQEFWGLLPERRELAYQKLRGTGAKVLVAWDPPVSKLDSRWKGIGETRYYAYFFSK